MLGKGSKFNMSPKLKRYSVLGLFFGGMALLIVVFGPSDDPKRKSTPETIKHVLTNVDTREVGIESLSAGLKYDRESISELQKEIEHLRLENEGIRRSNKVVSDNFGLDVASRKDLDSKIEELQLLKAELQQLREEFNEEKSRIKSSNYPENYSQQSNNFEGGYDNNVYNGEKSISRFGNETNNGNSSNVGNGSITTQIDGQLDSQNDESFIGDFNPTRKTIKSYSNGYGNMNRDYYAVQDKSKDQSKDLDRNTREGEQLEDSRILDRNYSGVLGNNSYSNYDYRNEMDSVRTPKKESDKGYYIPSGSILSGILITGLDAPTKENAKSEPFPVLINLDKNAILPNEYAFDFKECFVIAAAFGDMSSERVYARTENLSCITKEGRTVEVPINAYATGEDGKAGLRGRLVSKQGRLIARSMMAGFLEGLSGAFDVNQVPVLSTTADSNSMQYQRVYNSMALEGAAVAGSSKALEQLSSFYLKLAQQLFPVLEIDASRRVDLIVTKGFYIPKALSYDGY